MQTFLLIVGAIIAAIALRWQQTYHMHLEFPIDKKYSKQSLELFKKIHIRSSIEQFPVSYEVLDNSNIHKYVNVLHRQSEKEMRDYIERIPYTKQGHQFFRSMTTGRHNKFSITLIAHKQYEGNHTILIAQLSKEVTITLLSKILSPIKTILGWNNHDQQQLEEIMTNLSDEKNKQIMENLMMFIMADNLEQRYGNDLRISFIDKK